MVDSAIEHDERHAGIRVRSGCLVSSEVEQTALIVVRTSEQDDILVGIGVE